MPSAKRARQRAAKQAKQAELERQKRRRQTRRRAIVAVVAVAAAVGIYFAVSSGGGAKKSSSSAAAHTTSSGSSTLTSAQVTADQTAADKAAVAAGCPLNPKASLSKASYSSPPAMTIDTSKTYTATVKTDVGTFTMALDPAGAPIAVNSFVFLAQKGFFNCVTFHRVIPGFVVQGGDPTGTGNGGPGYQFTESGPPAAASSADQYPIGSVAMANSSSGTTDPSTNGSQFFIVTGAQGEALPPDYVLLGQVTSGMSVVQKISAQGSASGTPQVIHRMLKVTISS